MLCPSCTFNNSPMMRACVRCGSRFDLSGIDVTPRRRGSGTLLSRSRLRLARLARSSQTIGGSLERAWRGYVAPASSNQALYLSIIPGLGHLRLGMYVLGLLFLCGWLALLFASLVLSASQQGWWAYLGLVGLHAHVITILCARAMQHLSIARRAGLGLAICLCLHLLLYLPAYLIAGSFLWPLSVREILSRGVIQSGDTILVSGVANTPAELHHGDLVVYSPVTGGYLIDRVIAVGGQSISVVDGAIFVDGQPVPASIAPIGDVRRMPNMNVVIGPDQYGIIPSTLRIFTLAPPNDQAREQLVYQLSAATVVKRSQINGVVLFRLRPFARAGRVAEP